MAQVSEMMFTFQIGKTSSTIKSNSSTSSSRTKDSSFKADLTAAARDVDRNDSRKDDTRNDNLRPLQKPPKSSERLAKAERKLNKKLEQKPEEEKDEKKPEKLDKKTEDDLQAILNLLNNIVQAQPDEAASEVSDSKEVMEAVKELVGTAKTQGLNMDGNTKQNINKLLDMLKEITGKAETATGQQTASIADINQQLKDLVDTIMQAQQGGKTETAEEKVKTNNEDMPAAVSKKAQNTPLQVLYKMGRQNFELKNINTAQGQEDVSATDISDAALSEADAKPEENKEQPVMEETVSSQTKIEGRTAAPKGAGGVDKENIDVKDIQDVKLVQKDAAKDAKQEKGESNNTGQQEEKKTIVPAKANTEKLAADNKEHNNMIIKNDQVQNDKPFDKVMATARTEKTTYISKTDLINQIVKKAEVTVNDKQTEMRMQLEPENLGKLTLKVAIERGVVTAKFVAESQQVKEIIETNFNQLKDALAEKGINVQGFSVSVGQDNSGSSNNDGYKQLWQDNMKNNSRMSGNLTTGNYVETAADYISKPSNPYSQHDGKIDYKA